MLYWLQAVRLIAFALLLMTGVEVLACDVVSPSCCKLSNAKHGTDSDRANDGDDSCLCCCTHYVAPPGIQLVQLATLGTAPELIPAFRLLPEPARILHPPRS